MNIKYIIWVLLLTNLNLFSQEHSEISLDIPDSFSTEEYKDDLKNWRLSIYKKYNIEETKINEEIFLRTDINLYVNGKVRSHEVYQSLSKKNRYYIEASTTIIDFDHQLVGTMGVSGISTIKSKSKRIVIILAPEKNISLNGITLDFTGKTNVDLPIFNKYSVKFEWTIND